MPQVEVENVDIALGLYKGFIYRDHLDPETRDLFISDAVEAEGCFNFHVSSEGLISVTLDGPVYLYEVTLVHGTHQIDGGHPIEVPVEQIDHMDLTDAIMTYLKEKL